MSVAGITVPAVALQFAGSLLAILLLAWLAKRLGLGRPDALGDEDRIRDAAEQTVDGFEPIDIVRDSHGRAALVLDAEGRMILLKLHGGHGAGRMLDSRTAAIVVEGGLDVDCGERRFGRVRLQLPLDVARTWARAIERL